MKDKSVPWKCFLSVLSLVAVASLLLVSCSAGQATPLPAGTSTPQSPAGAQPVSSTAAVTIKGFAFDPASITVKVGTAVTWTNKDSAPHTITGDKGDWDSGRIAQGGTYTRTFDQAGTYAYKCTIHPTMTGAVVVTP